MGNLYCREEWVKAVVVYEAVYDCLNRGIAIKSLCRIKEWLEGMTNSKGRSE
jgi:hypothetical protein